MAAVDMSAESAGIQLNTVFKRWYGAALIVVAAFAVWQFTPRAPRAPAPLANALAVSHHCEQFVSIARANFGANWKPRLDPRDPLCADEIQRAWERQRIPRAVDIKDLPPPQLVETVAPIASPDPAPPAQIAEASQSASAARLETYCLNILGLARTKFGDDWLSGLTPQEAADCQSHMR
jgi:hypothetical protein